MTRHWLAPLARHCAGKTDNLDEVKYEILFQCLKMRPALTTIFVALIFIITIFSTPLSIGLSLLLIAFLATAFLAYAFSPLLAVILFLIYVGGVIIIFAYFIAATPRPNTTNDTHLFKLTTTVLLLFLPTFLINLANLNSQTIARSTLAVLLPFQTPQVAFIVTIILILLLAIIIIVKVVTSRSAPLRPYK